MDHRQQMNKYLAKVEEVMGLLEALAPIIRREVDRRFGRKIQAAKNKQEQDNLRQFYTKQVGQENIWKQAYLGDRDLYIRLATMYGIAALVDEADEPRLEPF